MKSALLNKALQLAIATVVLQAGSVAMAEEKPLVPLRTWTGTLTSVDVEGSALHLKRFWSPKIFNLTKDCRIYVGNNQSAQVSDLRPGMNVRLYYVESDGVAIASRVAQKLELITGSVTAIDTEKGTLGVTAARKGTEFHVAKDCVFQFNGDARGNLRDLRLGQRVTVTGGKLKDRHVAHRVVEPSEAFIGTVNALDSSSRTLKLKHLFGVKRFSLAEDCRIVIGNDTRKKLQDLRLDQKVLVDYHEKDGVLIATRIAPVESLTLPSAVDGPEIVKENRR